MRLGKVILGLAQLAGVAATIWLLWFSDIPLGVPGEWTWDRIPFDRDSLKEMSLGWGIAGIVTVVYVAFCLFVDRRIMEAERLEVATWLSGLILLGAIWHGVVQECPPDPHRLSKTPWVVWYRATQGYYAEARFVANDDPQYLAKYTERLKEGDVLHFGTHPPGFVMLHRTIIRFIAKSPKIQSWLLKYQPQSVRDALDVLAETNVKSATPITDLDRAALWGSSLLAALAAMTTVAPLFCLLRRTCSREAAWRLVCLWPLVPALAVFHPVSDLWMPLLATLFLATWCRAWSRRSGLFAVLAGGVMWLGMNLTLAMLPVAFLAAMWTIADFLFAEANDSMPTRMKSLAICVVSALSTFVALTMFLQWMTDLNLVTVWTQNFKNHAGFYAQYTRTYRDWVLVNPLELALAVGMPVFLLAVSSWIKGTRGSLRTSRSLASFRLWCLVTLLVLWLSGKNSGEAARLWIFLMPCLIWVSGREEKITAKIVNGPGQTLPEYTGSSPVGWVCVLVLQAVVCVATVSRVDGFKFKTTVPVEGVAVTDPLKVG